MMFRVSFLAILLFSLFASVPTSANEALGECDALEVFIATTPVPPQRPALMDAALSAFSRSDPSAEIVVIGDSQALHWPSSILQKLSVSGSVANWGLSGDSTQGALWRLQQPEVEGFAPQQVIIMIGGNSLGDFEPCAIFAGVMAVVGKAHEKWPDAQITYIAIPPRGTFFNSNDSARTAVNDAVASAALSSSWLKVIDADAQITCGLYGQVTPLAMIAKDAGVSLCRNYRADLRHLTEFGYAWLTDFLLMQWSKPS